MITACLNRKKLEIHEIALENQSLLNEAIWIDLLLPTRTEEVLVEECLGIEIPTRDEMIEIELSSRLYKEDGSLFMTAMMIAHSDSPEPKLDPVTFMLTEKQLITIRYIEPQAFKLFYSQLPKFDANKRNAETLLIELLDAAIDRLADILEVIARRLDEYSKAIFKPPSEDDEKLDYQQLMRHIGVNGDLNTKARESLVTLNRLITYVEQAASARVNGERLLRLTTLSKDISSLSDYANFISTKFTFLLDAILGMVSIEQNNIIKIFSVAAVIFLPPTLIASIYGMNFHFIPELSWRFGYLFAISMILIAAWLPYKYFKYKKWL